MRLPTCLPVGGFRHSGKIKHSLLLIY
jgi:hypothetical protein